MPTTFCNFLLLSLTSCRWTPNWRTLGSWVGLGVKTCLLLFIDILWWPIRMTMTMEFFLQEALCWASHSLGLNPHLKSTQLHMAGVSQLFFWKNNVMFVHLWNISIFWKASQPRLLFYPKAWAESESELQRAFFSYTMRRFQKNSNARYVGSTVSLP